MSWMTVKVSDFAEVVTGGTPSTSNNAYWESGTIPWLPSGACQNCVIGSANTFITELGLRESSAKMMPPNTVVIALTGATTGKVGLLAIDACANQSVTGILPSEKYVPTYLFHYLRSIREKVIGDSYGGAQKHISQGYVKNMEIPLPPLDIQHRIATLLDKAQSLITARREQIAVLDKLSKDLFVEMFGDPMLNPMKWESAILGDVCKVRSSKRIYQREQTREGVPFLRVSDIVSRITGQGETASLFISDALYDELDKSGLTPKLDDILVTSRGTLGRCYIVKDGDRFYFQDGMISWLDNSNQNINADYLVQVFQSEKVIKQIAEKSAGSTVAYLSLGNLQAVEIPCPPLSLQDEFGRQIGIINRQKARLTESLAELESLYKSLTQRAFAGELIS